MKISATLAKKIVEQLKSVIPYQLNFMSAEGIIIASTDESRTGTYHEGAVLAITKGTPVVIHYDGELEGARKGINLPIWFDNEVIGNVGITGEPEDVQQFGRIIVEMTSILIREAWINELNLRDRERHNLIVEALIMDPQPENHPYVKSYFLGQWAGEQLVVCGALEKTSSLEADEENSELFYKFSRRYLASYPQLFYMIDRLDITLIMPLMSLDTIRASLSALQNSLQARLGKTLYLGIGTGASELHDIAQSYRNALVALRGAVRQKRAELFYSEMDIDMLTTAVPEKTARQFVQKLLACLSAEELAEYDHILELYERHNGSLTRTAEALFIHKNTLQYQLNRLHARSGYNPRRLADFLCLRLAFKLRHELAPEGGRRGRAAFTE